MAVAITVAGLWRNIASCKVMASGAWREIVAIQVRSGGQWRVIRFPDSTSGSGSGAFSVAITPSPFSAKAGVTVKLTATPAGGQAPYTYAWQALSTNASIVSPTGATTKVSGSSAGPASVQCSVTDALGSVVSVAVSGTIT